MRKVIITLTLLLFGSLAPTGNAYAQRGLPGQLGIGINAGTVDGFLLRDGHRAYRFFTELELTRYNRNHSYWNFTACYLQKDYLYSSPSVRQLVPMSQMTVMAGYNLPLVSDRGRNVSLAAGLAAVVGYETTLWGVKTLGDGARLLNRDGMLYGAALTVAFEGYLSDRVILLVGIRQRLLAGSSTGLFHTQLSCGVRIIIN